MSHKNSDICDQLEWFVDCLGTTDFLEMILRKYDAGEVTVLKRRAGRRKAPTGLIFDGAHWVYKDTNTIYNSYNLKHQVRGTAHFCQTFALMYALQNSSNLKTHLDEGAYADNIRTAVKFWRKLFRAYPPLFNFFLREVQTWTRMGEQNKKDPASKPGGFVPQLSTATRAGGTATRARGTAKRLGKYTQKDLLKYMKWVEKNAESFQGCKEG